MLVIKSHLIQIGPKDRVVDGLDRMADIYVIDRSAIPKVAVRAELVFKPNFVSARQWAATAKSHPYTGVFPARSTHCR